MATINAKKFINAYNKIDNLLRNLYGYRDMVTFSDMIRKAAAANYVVRKYEEDLIDYARLRNAIIHKSRDDEIIAEPLPAVADKMQHIAALLSTPPVAFKFVKDHEVMCFPHDTRLREIVVAISGNGYSNIPIIRDGVMIGVLNNKRIVEELGKRLLNRQSADDFFNNATAGSILTKDDKHYKILKKTASIEQVLNLFHNNQSLRVVLFTEDGTNLGRPLGIITQGDLLQLNAELENYM